MKQYCDQYHKRIADLENKKFDLEKEVEFKEMQVEYSSRFSEGMLIAIKMQPHFSNVAPSLKHLKPEHVFRI